MSRINHPETHHVAEQLPHPTGFTHRIAVGVGILSTSTLLIFIGTGTIPTSAFFESSVPKSTPPVQSSASAEAPPFLRAASNIDPNPPKGGGDVSVRGTVLVADGSPFKTAQDTPLTGSSDQIALYLVRDGDTLSQVADMFDVSVNTIVWANELTSNEDIHPGQTLLILPVSGVQHTIQKGDTLRALAKKYGGESNEIIAYNGLPEDGSLTVGETITIPGGEVPSTPTSAASTKGGSVQSAAPPTGGSGYFIHPLPGARRTQGVHGYNAVDLGAPSGTPIRAAAGGTVIVSRSSGWNGGYGIYVVVSHPNGTQTLYAHMTKAAISQGAKVAQGQVIGYVGNTGKSTGNHLHFEVRGARNPF